MYDIIRFIYTEYFMMFINSLESFKNDNRDHFSNKEYDH